MSSSTTVLPAHAPAPAAVHPAAAGDISAGAGKALIAGIAGIVITAAALLIPHNGLTVATSWLIACVFWVGIGLGMLFLVMIHHIFDAGWSTVIRRQYEHGLSAFKWLALLFLPLVVLAWVKPGFQWGWMNPDTLVHGTRVGDDILYVKKAAFLNQGMFTGGTILFFAIWIGLSAVFRRNSFRQDLDGDAKWTFSSRKWSAGGLALGALTLTAAIIFWVKSLQYHWFSTMYGVWFFAGCMRAALSVGVIIMVWLWARGPYKGVLNNNHLHSIGQLMLAFTVFWAYVTFSQYFLIWNANVPEETFWYNIREEGQWLWVGMLLLFGHFFAPFLVLLQYWVKVNKKVIPWVAAWILFIFYVDICYNVMPAYEDHHHHGQPQPFLQLGQVWNLTALVGVGGVCVWAYLRSFGRTKLIPVRDPRIAESLAYHEPSAQ